MSAISPKWNLVKSKRSRFTNRNLDFFFFFRLTFVKMSKEAWQQRHCDDLEIWNKLLAADFPEESFILPDNQWLKSEDSVIQYIKIPSSLIYRDLLLALEQDQGFLFESEDNGILINTETFYLDHFDQPRILAIVSYPYGRPYIDLNRTLRDTIYDLITKTRFHLEREASHLEAVLKKYDKTYDLFDLPDRGSKINFGEHKKQPYARYPQPVINTLVKETVMMYWQLGGKQYAEVVLLKSPHRNLLMAPHRRYNFGYLTSNKLEELCYPLRELFFLE